MRLPRLGIGWVMVAVAVVALNQGVIRELSTPGSAWDGRLAWDALPMANVLALAGIAGFRARAFILGFEAVGMLSLLSYSLWSHYHPWAWLRYFEPPLSAIAGLARRIWADYEDPIVLLVGILVFVIHHTVFGLAGGYFLAKGRAVMIR